MLINMCSECTILMQFLKKFPGEAPRTPTCGRGLPPPPFGASRLSEAFGFIGHLCPPPAVEFLDPLLGKKLLWGERLLYSSFFPRGKDYYIAIFPGGGNYYGGKILYNTGFDSRLALTACGPSDGREVKDIIGRPDARVRVGSGR